MSQDSGLVKRGLILLGLMALLAVVLLSILQQRPTNPVPAASPRPELLATLLVRPTDAFPGAVDWDDIYKIAEAFPTPAGWLIRYNASITLARRGSAQVPWDILVEMLDENRQLRNFRVQLPDGKVVPDETAAHMTMLSALRAITEWHKKQTSRPNETPTALTQVYAAVDRLTDNPLMEIKSQAANTRQVFFR
jgi:hypothetical protein